MTETTTDTITPAAAAPAAVAAPSPPASPSSFSDFGLHPGLLQAVLDTGYTTPTPIQAQAIGPVIAGRDVMGAAQTGTGKTAAFSLPLLHRLMPFANTSASPARHPVRALILTPTRELADQVHASVVTYARHVPLRSAVVFGGVDIAPQREALRRGCEILIATPGRLLDHLEQKNVHLGQVALFVLDEADRMLDMGFLPDLERIVRLLPVQRQTLLFSATFNNDIRKLAHASLHNPVEVAVAARNATADTVTQIAYPVASDDKRAAVVHLVKSKGLNQVIVFSNTKIGTARLARLLERDGVRAESIHGDKSQQERMKALDAFKAGELEVLVATDVAARGLDVAGVPCVINYDLPFNPEDYVHRIGRTGRAGAKGEAIALFTADEERFLLDIEKLVKIKITRGILQLPPRSRAHSHSRAGSSGAERARSHRASGASSHAASAFASKPVDDFFLKPYVPAVPESKSDVAPKPEPVAPVRVLGARKSVGVLLGGAGR